MVETMSTQQEKGEPTMDSNAVKVRLESETQFSVW